VWGDRVGRAVLAQFDVGWPVWPVRGESIEAVSPRASQGGLGLEISRAGEKKLCLLGLSLSQPLNFVQNLQ